MKTSKTEQKEKKLLFGLLIKKFSPNGNPYLAINWTRIILLFLFLFIGAWLSLAGLLFGYFKYLKDYDLVKYKDMLFLPFKYADHKKSMGNYHIDIAFEELENQNVRKGLFLLQSGLARSPGNLKGIITMAEIYEKGLKQKNVAIDLYLSGFEYNGLSNEDFTKASLECLLRNKLDAEIISLANQYLPNEFKDGDNKNLQTLAYAAATSCFFKGNFDKSEDYINTFLLDKTIDGIILSSKISWDRGNKFSAIKKLESALYRFTGSDILYAQLSKYYREIDNFDSARRYAQLRNIKSPLNPDPIIDLIYLYDKYDKEDKVNIYSSQIIDNFNDNESAIFQLANFAATTGKINIAQFCYELALEKDYALENFALSLIEAHISIKDYEGAISFSNELLAENPKWLKVQMPIFNSLRALASFGINRPDLGEIYLGEFLNAQNINVMAYTAVSKRFMDNQMLLQAKEILETAYPLEPDNQRILNNLIRINLSLGHTSDLGNQISRLLETRRPDIDLLNDAYERLGSDQFLFTANRVDILTKLNKILREHN